jgi:hypothetical protein
MDDAVDFVFCLNAVTENATTNFLCLGQNIQAGLEASPAGGGGWAGAREACTAAPDGGSLSVVRCTEVMLTLRSWVGLSHVL